VTTLAARVGRIDLSVLTVDDLVVQLTLHRIAPAVTSVFVGDGALGACLPIKQRCNALYDVAHDRTATARHVDLQVGDRFVRRAARH
jgi:hypothetical protein